MGKFITKALLPILVLGVGLAIGLWFFANPKEAEKKSSLEEQTFLVETSIAQTGDYHAEIEAMGQVMPALEAALKPQVSGEIIQIAEEFLPGGLFRKNKILLNIDPEDYILEVQKREALYKQAEADFALEMGRQEVAKDELEILARSTGKTLENPSLALRQPQLNQARAELERMQAELDTAHLDLHRTAIDAPFNTLVTERFATLGDKVSPSDTLATLVSTDEYWIEISVPVNELRWLNIPDENNEQGSTAKIILDGRGQREGELLKLTGSLDQASRLADVLISVSHPLKIVPQLILNDYVKVVLKGKPLNDVVRVDLSWLRDNNIVWVNEDGNLILRKVEIIHEDRNYAYVKNLSSGEMIVTSDITVPIEGMKLRTLEEARKDVQQKMKGPKGPNSGNQP